MGLTSQHQQTSFADPQNGQSPIDADQVRANDNALRVVTNAHDADRAVHVESGAFASRPAAGTAGAMYAATDTKRFYLDTGSAWVELDYILTGTAPTGSGAALTALNASNLDTGTVPTGRMSGSYTGITAVGTLSAGAVPASLVTPGTFGGAGKYTFVATAAGYASVNLPHGTAPSSPVDGDMWTTTTGAYVRINGSTVGPLSTGGGGGVSGTGTATKLTKWTGTSSIGDSVLTESATELTSTLPLFLPAGTTSLAALRVPHGSAPTSPVNGDVWTETTGMYARINGATVGPFGAGGGGVSGTGTANKMTKWTGTSTIADSTVTDDGSTVAFTTPGVFPAATTSIPSIRLPHGTAPTSPTNGDIWTTTAGLYARINGGTVGPFGTGGGGAPTGASYLTLGLDGTLTAERVLTAGTNVSFVDGGAGSTLTINVTTFVGGSGSSGKLAKFTASGTIGDSILTESGAAITIAGALTTQGITTLGSSTTHNIIFTGRMASTILFQTDATYDIGATAANRPKDYYGSGNGTFGGNVSVGGTVGVTGKLTTAASGTASAGLILPHGTAPTTPVNGDIWTTTAGMYAQINGSTVGPFGTILGSGTTGKIAKFSASGTIASSLFEDDATNPKVAAALLPTTTNSYDLGSSAAKFKDIYLGTTGKVYVNGTQVVGAKVGGFGSYTGTESPDPWSTAADLATLVTKVGALWSAMRSHGLI